MIFKEEFLKSLADEPIAKITEALDIATACWDSNDRPEVTVRDYEVTIEIYCILNSVAEMREDLNYLMPDFELTGNTNEDYFATKAFVNRVHPIITSEFQKIKIESVKKRISSQIGVVFSYAFTEGDLERIQTLINELRNEAARATYFNDDHKRRFLARLEQLQKELHKNVSDLSRFWGMVGEAGVVLGKFGTDAKPLADRIREMTQIVWRTQSRMEELPSDTPLPKLEGHSNPSDLIV